MACFSVAAVGLEAMRADNTPSKVYCGSKVCMMSLAWLVMSEAHRAGQAYLPRGIAYDRTGGLPLRFTVGREHGGGRGGEARWLAWRSLRRNDAGGRTEAMVDVAGGVRHLAAAQSGSSRRKENRSTGGRRAGGAVAEDWSYHINIAHM
ncbi:hypothetical protein B0H14DRAFT_3532393 [Mycena olivaceomarginata]|nr:hypothetical protein B0H14DRAFT_3532393 [Mycena olivaceomarginata]